MKRLLFLAIVLTSCSDSQFDAADVGTPPAAIVPSVDSGQQLAARLAIEAERTKLGTAARELQRVRELLAGCEADLIIAEDLIAAEDAAERSAAAAFAQAPAAEKLAFVRTLGQPIEALTEQERALRVRFAKLTEADLRSIMLDAGWQGPLTVEIGESANRRRLTALRAELAAERDRLRSKLANAESAFREAEKRVRSAESRLAKID